MSVQHYFVVACEDGKWFIDHGTADARFPDGGLWDTDAEEWRYALPGEGENEALADLELRLR